MIRPLIVAASVLASMPAYAVDVNCRPTGVVMATAADNPRAPQRLTGDAYSAVRDEVNRSDPDTPDYDGPLWVKVMGKSVLIGALLDSVPDHVCFFIVPDGAEADRIIALMQPT